MANNQKLELTWLGKDKEIKIETRILVEDKEKSNCKNDPNTENMLIHGDNLLALKALENKYAGNRDHFFIFEVSTVDENPLIYHYTYKKTTIYLAEK